jgi:molybdenum cofactor cytidylyltransferase
VNGASSTGASATGAAIILAAGFSRRMGRLKPLLPLGEGTLADYVIAAYLQNKLDVYLVVGHEQEAVRAGIKSTDVTIVGNPDYARGMFTSVQAGVRALPASCDRFFITPIDIPLVSGRTIARLLTEARDHPDAVVRPSFGGRRGHPVLVPARLISTILKWDRPGGLKALLAEDNNNIAVTVPDANILFDVDSPADYEELLARFQRENVSVPRSI